MIQDAAEEADVNGDDVRVALAVFRNRDRRLTYPVINADKAFKVRSANMGAHDNWRLAKELAMELKKYFRYPAKESDRKDSEMPRSTSYF